MVAKRRGAKKIIWKADQPVKEAPLKPMPSLGDYQRYPGQPATDFAYHVADDSIGALFRLRDACEVYTPPAGCIPPPHPYLVFSWYPLNSVKTFSKGTLAVYAGTVRTEEARPGHKVGGVSRVTKHSFIIGESRYLINDVTLLEPIK